ncbi:MAG: hypothetical protein AAB303_02755 [Chloroflexota bacterium]
METNSHHAGPADQARALEERWATDPRFNGVRRDYTAQDVVKLRGTLKIEYTLAKMGAERLLHLLGLEECWQLPVCALVWYSALTKKYGRIRLIAVC